MDVRSPFMNQQQFLQELLTLNSQLNIYNCNCEHM